MCYYAVSNNDDNNGDAMVSADFTGTFVQQDQMARPAINTVFLLRDNLKMTLMLHSFCNGCKVPSHFQSRLLALNAGYTTNALGQTANAYRSFSY
jgi:hypothetical protein